MNLYSVFIIPYNFEGNTDICGCTYSNGSNKFKNPVIIPVSTSILSLKNKIGISKIIYLNIFITSSSVKK